MSTLSKFEKPLLSSLRVICLLLLFAVAYKSLVPRHSQVAADSILPEIEALVKDDLIRGYAEKGVTYPPDAVVFRAFKKEGDFEIWAKNAGQPKMSLIKTVRICAVDRMPGPKLQEGDLKTPEGFYHPEFGYASKKWWMWIRLNRQELDCRGEVGEGSCFKMCIEYPNEVDRANTRAAGMDQPGNEICLHGNCVSTGCISFSNRDFLDVFAGARHHDAGRYGRLQLHIFPFRFDRVPDPGSMMSGFIWFTVFTERKLGHFWRNLREGFDKFNTDPNPLKIRIEGNQYIYD